MSDRFQLKAIIAVVDRLTPTLGVINKAVKNTRTQLGAIGGAVSAVVERIGLPLGLITGALGGASLAGLKALADNYAQLGAGLDDQSKRTGLAVERLQELNYIAQMSDVSIEGLQRAVARLNLGLANAASGKDKSLSALFNRLNIDPGKVQNAADLLPRLADAFQRNTDAVTRARMGTALFGKGYQELLPLLVDGSEALDDLVARYRRVAMPISAADAAAAADYADATDDLRLSWQGFQSLIGARVLPLLTPVIQRMTEWTVANREWLANGITQVVEDLGRYLSQVDFRALLSGMASAVRSAGQLIEALGGAKTVLIGLGVLLLAGPVLSLIQLGVTLFGAAKGMAALLAAANPVVLGLIAIGVAAVAVISHWDKVKSWFAEFFEWIGKKFDAFTGWIGDLVSSAGRFLGFGGGDAGGGGMTGFSQPQPSKLVAGGTSIGGALRVEFVNTPQGTMITELPVASGLSLTTNVGYRSFAGMSRG